MLLTDVKSLGSEFEDDIDKSLQGVETLVLSARDVLMLLIL